MILRTLTICALLTLVLTNYAVAQCTWRDRNPEEIEECPNDNDPPYEADCSTVIVYGSSLNCLKDNVWIAPSNGLIINMNNADENSFNSDVTYVTWYIKLTVANGSIATLPTKILEMSRLTDIEISDNKLSRINFNDFLPLSRLKRISLVNNKISILDTTEGSGSYSLVNYIDLSYNIIENVPNNFLCNFRDIQFLNFSHNIISSISSHAFEGAVQLETLDLSYNRLKDLGNLFANIPKLYDPNYGPWTNLGKLSKLILDDNIITFLRFSDYFDTKISELSIGGNPIPCEILLEAKYSNFSDTFDRIVTAVTLNCRSKNVNGIACQNYPNNTGFASNILNISSSPIIILLKNAIENNTKSLNNLVEIARKNEKMLENLQCSVETDNRNHNALGDEKKYFHVEPNLEEVLNEQIEKRDETSLDEGITISN